MSYGKVKDGLITANSPCLVMVIGPTQVTYILPHHHQLAKAQGGGGGPGLPHRGIGVPPPAHMQDLWLFYVVYVYQNLLWVIRPTSTKG